MKKIKLKVHSDKLFAYVALFSMVANILSPFAALIPATAYAEGTPAEQTTQSVEEQPSEEPKPEEEAPTEEPKEEPAPVSTEETQEPTKEEPTQQEAVVEPSNEIPANTFTVDPEVITEGTPAVTETQETITETTPTEPVQTGEQPGDILPDGASDYRPEAEVGGSETTEVQEIVDPVATEPSGTEPAVIVTEPSGTEPSIVVEPVTPVVEETPVEVVKEYETLAEGAEIKDSVEADWVVDGEKAETKEVVKLGVKYIFPIDSKDNEVSVTFTKLPKLNEDRSKLKIERVKVSDLNLPDNFKTDAEYAFDITTPDMDAGEFEYDLTLPKPKGVDAEVAYIEKSIDEAKDEVKSEDVNKIEGDKVDQGDGNVKVENLDHFTIYVVSIKTYDMDITTLKTQYKQGETVYVKADLTKNNDYYYKLFVVSPSGSSTPVSDCVKNKDNLSGSYVLPSNALVSSNWQAVVKEYWGGSWLCDNDWFGDSKSTTFEVIANTIVPVSNPSLSQSCGIDVGLVIDTSSSIENNELATMKTAFNNFINAFVGTPTRMAIVSFDDSAVVRSGFTSDLASLHTVINGIDGDGYTNWEDALLDTRNLFPDRADKPDLIVFTSDGNPTASSAGPNDLNQPNVHLAPAVIQANVAKNDGIRIITLGIGNDVNPTRLQQISSADAYYSSANFDTLTTTLQQLATDLCGGTITVQKTIPGFSAPSTYLAGWEFTFNGHDYITDNSGKTDAVPVTHGDYSITETVKDGYSLATASCTGAANNGTKSGNSINGVHVDSTNIISCVFNNTADYTPTRICHATHSEGNPFNLETPNTLGLLMGHVGTGHQNGEDIIPPISVFLPSGQNWDTEGQAIWNNNCNIPPTTGTLIVIKNLINDNGGTKGVSNFSFSIDGNSAIAFEADGRNDVTVNAGVHSVTEPSVGGYSTTYSNCTSVNVPAGGTATCTITNNDIGPTLTVVKTVKNDNGGNKQISDFHLYIDGVAATSSTSYPVTANVQHTVTEDSLTGYTPSEWGGDCSSDGKITLNPGENKTCTITNDDVAPTLTLVKVLPNDNGGNESQGAFNVYIDSTPAVWGSNTTSAGMHTVKEDTITGYSASVWSGDCSSLGIVTLNPGDTKTCTITNDDQAPTIALIKSVTNDNGGSAGVNDFGLTIGGSPATSGVTYSVMANTPIAINEAGLLGYSFVSITGGGCPTSLGGTVTLNEGQNITCTITNDDVAPITIKAYKIVCDAESYLPNWGTGGPDITANTAQNWVDSSNGHCKFEPNWKFQWSFDGVGNPGDNIIGEAGTGWNTFGPTDSTGFTQTEITKLDTPKLWFREVLQAGYIPFSYGAHPDNSDNVSAGFYCNSDVLNYDNWEWIEKPQFGNTYYCVAWNALKTGSLGVTKVVDWTGITPDSSKTFEICITGPSYTTGDCKTADYDGETLIWNNLLLGDYTVTETNPGTIWSVSGSGSVISVGSETSATHQITNTYIPYCGDGVRNQETEQCDGIDGVTKDLNFCTPTCKLIPIYDEGHSCTDGKTPIKIGNYTIGAKDADGVSFGVTSGQEYLFKVLGTYNYDINNAEKYADGAYGTSNNWGSVRSDIGIWGTNRGVISVLGDLGNGVGVIEWDNNNTFNSDHVYQKVYTPTVNTIQFLISDWYDSWYTTNPSCNGQGCMSDNDGSLELEVYECIDARPSISIQKEGPDFVLNGSSASFDYKVTNTGNVVLSTVSVEDNKCSSITFSGGDTNSDNLLDLTETWTYTCTYNPTWVFNQVITNTATAHGYLNETEVTDTATYDLYSFILRKDIQLKIGDVISPYTDQSNTLFDVEIKKDGEVLGTVKIGEEAPAKFWLGSGTYDLCEINMPTGYTSHYTDGCINFTTGSYPDWTQINYLSPVIIKAYKIVCDAESYLPNLGNGGGTDITENTASDFVNNSEGHCRLEPNWKFQWSFDGVGNPGDNIIDEAGTGWNTFGPTDTNGLAQAEITNLSTSKLWFREVLQDTYLPFSYGAHPDNSDPVSAEFYCNNDVLNYDNWEWVDNAQLGNTYYCVAYNTLNYGSISGTKFNDGNGDGISNESDWGMSGWAVFLDKNENKVLDTDEVSTITDESGNYIFNNLLPGIYKVCEVNQDGWIQTSTPDCYAITVRADNHINNNFGNFQKGSFQGCKYDDLNGDGTRDRELEPQIGGWVIKLYDSSWNYVAETTTVSGGTLESNYSFSNVMEKGTYYVCEVMQTGWAQTEPNAESGIVNNSPNKTNEGPYCRRIDNSSSGNSLIGQRFGNVLVNPELRISKENNTGGNTKVIGDQVTFTIKIRALSASLKNVKVTDLLPKGFKFITGSSNWSVVSDVHSALTISDPTYASPGVWDIGSMDKDEEITITYKAEIQPEVDPGIYKDLAMTMGKDILNGNVLGLSENPGEISTYFVGTQVGVVKEKGPVEDTIDVEETEKEEEVGKVLGASTELPATGASTTFIKVVLLIGLVGGLLLIIGGLGTMLKNKKILPLLLLAFGMSVFGTKAVYAETIDVAPEVRIEDPKSPATGPFGVTFVVMDVLDRDMTAECYVEKPGESSFSLFGSVISVTTGGNTYVCDVTSAVLGVNGTYKFLVKVTPTGGSTVESAEVSVNFDGDSPEKPEYIEKDKKSDCKYDITVKTADDGQTSYIEIFRDDSKEMDLNSSHLIKTKTIGPDEKYEFTDEVYSTDCGHTQYYAVIAFDSAGNASDPRAEEVVTKVTVTKTEKTEVLGALEIPGGVNLPEGTGAGTGTGATAGETGGGGGSVLGEKTAETGKGLMGIFKTPWFWLILIVLAYITARGIKNKKKKK